MRQVDWVFMGPEPHLATCQRCKETIAKPELPTTFPELLAFLGEATKLHAACR